MVTSIKLKEISYKGKRPKESFSPKPIMWVSYLGLLIAGPHNFRVRSVGSYYPFNRHRVHHFLPNLADFGRFTPISLPKVFQLQ